MRGIQQRLHEYLHAKEDARIVLIELCTCFHRWFLKKRKNSRLDKFEFIEVKRDKCWSVIFRCRLLTTKEKVTGWIGNTPKRNRRAQKPVEMLIRKNGHHSILNSNANAKKTLALNFLQRNLDFLRCCIIWCVITKLCADFIYLVINFYCISYAYLPINVQTNLVTFINFNIMQITYVLMRLQTTENNSSNLSHVYSFSRVYRIKVSVNQD